MGEALDAAGVGTPAAAPREEVVKSFHAKVRAAPRQVVVDKPSGKTYQSDDGGLKGSTVESAAGAVVYEGGYR